MRSVRVDAKGRRAWVEGGATSAGVNRETQLHGLAVTGGVVSSTGVAGPTLGGGPGWLMGKHGLALDNLLAVELVTADGQVLRASGPSFSGLCGAAVATLASRRPSSSACTLSDPL
jgi:FAD/FMN-containing dehydrogenase